MYTLKDKKTTNVKLIIIIILAVALAGESILCVFLGLKSGGGSKVSADDLNFSINLDTSALGKEIATAVTGTATELISGLKNEVIPTGSLTDVVRGVVYSDAIVNTVMSMSYPLLFNTLTSLGLMDFAENVALYPTGPQFASLLEGKGYTAVDADGQRKDITEVLKNAGSDWSYMDQKVTVANADGTSSETTIWNSCVWGAKDRDTFYNAMQDMSAGLRGVLEIAIQHKERIVNINPVDYLLGFDKINVRMDAATVFADTPASGYSLCLVPLFNMLGLVPGEYPDDATVCGYENLGDVWRAILEPVLAAVDKAAADPVNRLPDMLVNFIVNLENGSLCDSMRQLRLDGDYADLASLAMGYEDGLIFNLGEALLQIIGSMGINITGSFNDVLDSLLGMITKNAATNMPDIDTSKLLAGATTETLANGYTYYHASADSVVNTFVEYIIGTETVALILDQTPLKGTQAAADITAAVGESAGGLRKLVNVAADLILEKIGTPAN